MFLAQLLTSHQRVEHPSVLCWQTLSIAFPPPSTVFASNFCDLLSSRFVLRPNPNHVDKCLSLGSSLCLVKQRSFWCCSTSATVSEARTTVPSVEGTAVRVASLTFGLIKETSLLRVCVKTNFEHFNLVSEECAHVAQLPNTWLGYIHIT